MSNHENNPVSSVNSNNSIIVGNKDSHIAICTLWSEKEIVAKDIDKNLYKVIGNLYSNKGINYIIRNVLADPSIKIIVLLGKDLSGSGEVFNKLMDEKSDIKSYEFDFLDVEEKYVIEFKKRVKLVDLRKKTKPELIERLKVLSSEKFKITDKPIIIEEIIEMIDTLPSEDSCYMIREEQVSDAFIKVNDLILKFGEVKETQYDTKEKELLNTIITITDKEQKTSKILNVSDDKLKEYLPTIMSKAKPDEIVYTYGSRLFSYDVEEYNQVDQIQNIISMLNKTKHSRRAVAITWNVKKDYKSDHPPCLVYQNYLVKKNKLYLTTVFRSNDMYKAFPLNALALNELLKFVCNGTNLEYGSLTIISNSAHIYETDWSEAKKKIENYKKNDSNANRFIMDPRGYFIINAVDNNIEVVHYTNKDIKSGYIFKESSARRLYNRIIKENLISRLDHAAYLGEELAKAETCIKNGTKYIQDK